MLYLVEGRVKESKYMIDSSTTRNVIRLVDAISDAAAEEKFVNYFTNQSSDYAVSYYAYVDTISEVIS